MTESPSHGINRIMNTELNFRQEMFSREYVVDGNASRAAKDAGYSEKTAYSKGHELLKIVGVKERVDELAAEAAEKAELKMAEVIEYWREVITNPEEKTSDRTKVSELIAKYLGAFTKKVEIETKAKPGVTQIDLDERIRLMEFERKDVVEKDVGSGNGNE